MSEPKYDEDLVNLGYLKKTVSDTEENINKEYENVSRHYGSRPQPPYNKGDTWIDGDIVYVCIKSRQIGTYDDSDWATESGAKKEAEKKNKVFLRQPSNYSPGDMWILQSDNDHKAGKKGEMLISTAGRAEYDEGDWINMLGYGSIRSINEVADNLNKAIDRIGDVEEAIEDGIIITFYQDSEPEGKHIGDLWYVTGEVEGYTKGKLYRYDGAEWRILDDPAIQKAFDEANEARIVADGKIQSFYSDTEPTKNMGVGDLWIDLANNNQLYRYNGTKWVAVYDTRINELVVNVETVTERVTTVETDLGEIDLKVKETTTKITTIEGDVNNITNTTSPAEGKNIHITDSAEEPLVDISLHGETNQATRSGKNKLKMVNNTSESKGLTSIVSNEKLSITGQATDNWATIATITNLILDAGTYTFSISKTIKYHVDLYLSVNGTVITVGRISAGQKSMTFTIDNRAIGSTIAIAGTTIGEQVDLSDIGFQIESGSEASDWEFYGASPSPEFPSEIENVEGKNKFDNNQSEITASGTYLSDLETGKRAINKVVGNFAYSAVLIPNSDNLLGKKVTLSGKIAPSSTNKGALCLYGLKSDNIPTYNYGEINTSGSVTITLPSKYPTNVVKFAILFYSNKQGTVTVGDYVDYTDVQLEIGERATKYVPYNSLAVKVIGKNLFDIQNATAKSNVTISPDGTVTNINELNSITKIRCQYFKDNIYVGNGEEANIVNGKNSVIFTKQSIFDSIAFGVKSSPYDELVSYDVSHFENGKTYTISFEIISLTSTSVVWNNMQIEEGTVTAYEPYKEQRAYFPLAEGQKLMEGSYLAEDGVHHKRWQDVFDGTENWEVWGRPKNYGFMIVDKCLDAIASGEQLCSCLMHDFSKAYAGEPGYFGVNASGILTICVDAFTTVNEWKAYLSEQYANGTPFTVEYELAEEEIIPYTEEQQEAWNKIRALTTYKNVTNISSDAYAKIVYMRDNGLDVYETKQNADKRYVETTEKFAEQKITVDGVKTQVSETEKRLTNEYLTAEQVNAEINGTKEDIEILRQRQSSTELTAEEFKIQFDKINNEGVSKIKTSMGYTFDDEGMKINKENADTGTIVDEAGFRVLDKTGISEQNLLYAGYVKEGDTNYPDYIGQTIVATANLIVQNYLVVGANSRFEDYVNPELGGKGTGTFEI